MEHHQRSGSGNGLMIGQMTDTFRMPKDFAVAGLPEHGAAGRGHPLRRGALAAQHGPRQRHALLAAQRLLAGGLLVQPRLLWALEGAALRRPALLRPGAALDRGPSRPQHGPLRHQRPARRLAGHASRWSLETLSGEVLASGEEAVAAAAVQRGRQSATSTLPTASRTTTSAKWCWWPNCGRATRRLGLNVAELHPAQAPVAGRPGPLPPRCSLTATSLSST